MRLPEKIKRYESMREIGFPVKPCVYARAGEDKKAFVVSATSLLEEYPIVMVRTAADERGMSLAQTLNMPRKYNLKSSRDISSAYDSLIKETAMLPDPWFMAWHFYPKEGLISTNMIFSDSELPRAEIFYGIGHENTTAGSKKVPLKLVGHYNSWKFLNPELEGIAVDRARSSTSDNLLERYMPKSVFFDALDSLSFYTRDESRTDSLRRGASSMVLESITQMPSGPLRGKKHFTLDYVLEG